MRTSCLALLIAACGLAASSPAYAQRRIPFFDAAGTGFDPEISVVNSGALLDAQVAVSHDLKYVTINARPSNSQLLALREFSFANSNNPGPQFGFVGGAGQAPAAAAAGAGANGRRALPRGVGRGGGSDRRNALDRPGTTFVGRLRD